MEIFKNCKTFVLICAGALLLTGCGPKHAEVVAEVSTSLDANLATDFAQLTFDEQSYSRGMQPTVTFSGKTSTILVREKPELHVRTFLGDELKLSGLAITKNGNYFTFTYQTPLLAHDSLPVLTRPCVAAGCRYFGYNSSISRQGAMEWFFHSKAFTPERFKELFGEDAPPKKVEA